MNEDLKLKIELVPSTNWYNNLRNNVSKLEWDKLRKRIYSENNYKCGVCKDEGRLNCHEIWDYDDKKHVQTLKGFIALCDNCHNIKHIGLSRIRASRGEIDFDKLIKHFMKVNNCGMESFNKHEEEAFDTWKKRLKFKLNLNLSNIK